MASSNSSETSPVYYFSNASANILLPLSITIWFVAIIGNARMLFHKKVQSKVKTVSNRLFLILLISNLAATLTAVSVHIVKLIIDYLKFANSSSICCLLRYFLNMTTIDFSLMSLTVLIIEQKDKIIKVPYGINARFHIRNINKLIVAGLIIACVPNLTMTAAYWYVFKAKNILPCQKNAITTSTNTTLTVIESVKKLSIAVPSITFIIRSTNELRTKLKVRTIDSDRMKRAIRKINISFLYAGAFLVFWLPFGCIALASGQIPKEYYDTWFNIGYTISFGYLIGIPVTCALTDTNFRRQKNNQEISMS